MCAMLQVNNSAATKLGDWRNVNQPSDPRTFFERLVGAKNPSEFFDEFSAARPNYSESS